MSRVSKWNKIFKLLFRLKHSVMTFDLCLFSPRLETTQINSPTLWWISPTMPLPRSTAPPVVLQIMSSTPRLRLQQPRTAEVTSNRPQLLCTRLSVCISGRFKAADATLTLSVADRWAQNGLKESHSRRESFLLLFFEVADRKEVVCLPAQWKLPARWDVQFMNLQPVCSHISKLFT